MATKKKTARLTEEQEREGYRVEQGENGVLVWHRNNQVAMLLYTQDIDRRVQEVIERKRQEIKEVERKTGWKPD